MAMDGLPQDPNDNKIEPWTMVVIRDSPSKSEFSVFPPNNHENLHLSLRNTDPVSPSLSSSSSSLASSSSSSSFSPSDSEQWEPDSPQASDSQVKRTGECRWWVRIGLEVLRSRILRFVSSFGGNGVVCWKASCFASGAGIAAVVVMIWSLYVRARQRRMVEKLMGVVREKDQKINQLLHQIAQLNEVLIVSHRVLASKVPN